METRSVSKVSLSTRLGRKDVSCLDVLIEAVLLTTTAGSGRRGVQDEDTNIARSCVLQSAAQRRCGGDDRADLFQERQWHTWCVDARTSVRSGLVPTLPVTCRTCGGRRGHPIRVSSTGATSTGGVCFGFCGASVGFLQSRRLLADIWSRPGEDRLKTCLLAASNTVVRARFPWSTTNPSGLVWMNLCIKSCGGSTTIGAYDSFVQVGGELDLLDSQAVADREGSAESMRILTSSNANSFERSSGSPLFCDV